MKIKIRSSSKTSFIFLLIFLNASEAEWSLYTIVNTNFTNWQFHFFYTFEISDYMTLLQTMHLNDNQEVNTYKRHFVLRALSEKKRFAMIVFDIYQDCLR